MSRRFSSQTFQRAWEALKSTPTLHADRLEEAMPMSGRAERWSLLLQSLGIRTWPAKGWSDAFNFQYEGVHYGLTARASESTVRLSCSFESGPDSANLESRLNEALRGSGVAWGYWPDDRRVSLSLLVGETAEGSEDALRNSLTQIAKAAHQLWHILQDGEDD